MIPGIRRIAHLHSASCLDKIRKLKNKRNKMTEKCKWLSREKCCLFVLPFLWEKSGTSCEVRWGVGKQINIPRTWIEKKGKIWKIWRRRRRDGEELMDEWVPQAVAGMTHMGRGTFHFNSTHTSLSLIFFKKYRSTLQTPSTFTPLVINFLSFLK
jgi:hypothetical protein